MSFTQCPFLHHDEEDGNQNQDVDGGSNHAADDRRGNRLHHIGAYAGFPKDWNQTGKHRADCHQLWPQTMHSTLNGCIFDIDVCQCNAGAQFVFERFMEIHHHDHSGLYCDSEERNVTDCHGDAEVVVEKPLQEYSSSHCIDGWKDQDQRFGYGVEYQVQQHENHKEDHGKDQLQSLFGTEFEFVLSGPLESVIGRQRQLAVNQLVCL